MTKLINLLLCSIIFTNVYLRKSKPMTNYLRRIFGGQLVEVSEFPHHVGIAVNKRDVFCGGSIISERCILSAAHCRYVQKQLYGDTEVDVIVGTKNIKTGGVLYKAIKILVHPQWQPDVYEYDVLLITTDKAITMRPGLVRVVKLPEENTFVPVVNSKVWTCGWGSEENRKRPDVLKKIGLTTVSEAECEKIWPKRSKKRICAFSQTKGWGTCNGDSGGGLIYQDRIVGILSYGTKKCNINVLEVYTDLHYYIDWIKNNMK